jgi:hypothetical protein
VGSGGIGGGGSGGAQSGALGQFIKKMARGSWHRDAKAFGNSGAAGYKVFAEELFGAEVRWAMESWMLLAVIVESNRVAWS